MSKSLFLYIFCLVLFLLHSKEGLSAIENSSTVTYPVGELGEQWQFPSDHLPIAATVGNIHFAAWNILNTRYIYHIITDQQGLRDSLIITANLPVEKDSLLTRRESIIIDQVLDMIEHPTYPRSLIALQETGTVLFEELKKRLPSHMACVTSHPDDLAYGDIFIYDTNIFEWISLRSGIYEVRPRNTYMTLTVQEKENGRIFHFVQSHVPGGPGVSAHARIELAEEIMSNFDPESITVIMGDMNRSADFFLKDFEKAAAKFGLSKQPFGNLWIPYATHIDTYRRASWIDNLFLYNAYEGVRVNVAREAREIFSDLRDTLDLLKFHRPYPLDVSFEVWSQLQVKDLSVIFGPLYSAKEEQMLLALQDKQVDVFDLRESFLEDYYAIHNISDPEEQSEIRMLYSLDDSFERLEQEWLSEQKDSIVKEFITSSADVVVFDGFDIIKGCELNADKLATVLDVAQMAKDVLDNNKKVVLIMHKAGFKSSTLWKYLSDDLSIIKENVVRAKYFSKDEEKYLMDRTSLSEEEASKFMQWAQGNPSAYLSIMIALAESKNYDSLLNLSLDELTNDAIYTVRKVWKEIKITESQLVVDTLVRIAQQDLRFEELHDSVDPQKLSHTGLIGSRQGDLVMPQLVKDVIAAFP